MRWAVLLSILVLVAGAVPAMGVPAEMSKKQGNEKPFMHAGGGISPHEHASIQVPKPEKRSEVEEKLFNKTKERLLNWTDKCENWISRMDEKITTLNMSDEAKARIEKRAEDAKKMVEEMRSKIENAENLADLRNVTKNARILWANLSKEMRLIAASGDSNASPTREREAGTDADTTNNNNAGNRLKDSIFTIFCFYTFLPRFETQTFC